MDTIEFQAQLTELQKLAYLRGFMAGEKAGREKAGREKAKEWSTNKEIIAQLENERFAENQ